LHIFLIRHVLQAFLILSLTQVRRHRTADAWNEYGEGGILSPTQGDGYMKLDTIADVFGRHVLDSGTTGPRASATAKHDDADSSQVPIFPQRLDLFPSAAPGHNPFQGIPALVAAGNGTFVAVIQDSVYDVHGTRLYSQLAARTSTSGGSSWSPERPLPPFNRQPSELRGFASSNPALVYDGHTDTVIVHFTLGTLQGGPINETVQCVSRRPFTTWSEPRSLVAELAPGLPPNSIAWPGPGHGIQLQGGPFAGRLLMTAWFWDSSDRSRHGKQNATTYFSDTHGRSWSSSGVSLPCDESQVVELKRPSLGSVALYGRHGQDNKSWAIPCQCQSVALSTDSGASFGAVPWLPSVQLGGQAISYDPRLVAPGPGFGMEACVVRVNSSTLAFANSQGLRGGGGSLNRGRMTVRMSNSEGEHWMPGVVVDAGPTSYCDIASAGGGGVALLWMARYHEYNNTPGNDFTVLRSDDDDVAIARRNTARVDWWVEYSAKNVMEFDRPPTRAASEKLAGSSAVVMVLAAAMAGETEHRQLVGRLPPACSVPVHNVSIVFEQDPSAGATTSPMPLSWLRWRQQVYVNCTAGGEQPFTPGWFPDPVMTPLAGGVSLLPNTTASLWVTVAVPRMASSGTYSAVGVVKTPSSELLRFEISQQVWPIELPSLAESRFGTAFQFSEGRPLVVNTSGKQAYFDFTCQHRMPPDELYIFGTNPPAAPRSHDDYEWMATKCDGGAHWMNLGEIDYIGYGCHDAGNSYPRCLNYTVQNIDEKLEWLSPTVEWLVQSGWANKSYVYGFDEASPKVSSKALSSLVLPLELCLRQCLSVRCSSPPQFGSSSAPSRIDGLSCEPWRL
jgi:hypothetical protein